MADLINIVQQRITDDNDDPVPGAKVYVYQVGTVIAETVYQDSGLATPHTTPITADANGLLPQIFHNGAVKVNVLTADDVQVSGFPLDPVHFSTSDQSAADGVSITPKAELPYADVQEALEGNVARIVALEDASQSGSRVLISETVADNTVSTYTFAFDSSLYSGYEFELYRLAAISGNAYLHFGASATSDYVSENLTQNTAAVTYSESTSLTGFYLDQLLSGSSRYATGIAKIFAPHKSDLYTVIDWEAKSYLFVEKRVGGRPSLTDEVSATIFNSTPANNFTGGSIRFYGYLK